MQESIALSIEQAQEICGLGRTKLYELLKSGELPARKLGKRTLILRSDLEAFLSSLKSYPAKENTQSNGGFHA